MDQELNDTRTKTKCTRTSAKWPAGRADTSAGAQEIMKIFDFLMFLSILGQNGTKTKTRPEAVLEARDARKARVEAGPP